MTKRGGIPQCLKSVNASEYVVCKDKCLRMKHFVWLSTPVPVTDLMTDRSGNVHEVVPVPDKPGSASWRSMSGSLQTLLGTWLVIGNPRQYSPQSS